MVETGVSSQVFDDDPNDDDGPEGTEGPACLGCRKRKRKCSRTHPCFYCTKYNLECEYDELKAKPKVKAGILQSHSERLDNLEKMFLGQSLILQKLFAPVVENINSLANLATPDVLARLKSESTGAAGEALLALSTGSNLDASLSDTISRLRQDMGLTNRKRERSSSPEPDRLPNAREFYRDPDTKSNGNAQTRTSWMLPSARRSSSGSLPTSATSFSQPNGSIPDKTSLSDILSNFHDVQSYLPPDDLVDSLVDVYDQFIQPWIPVLHRSIFRARLADPVGRKSLEVVLHAVVAATAKFSRDPRLSDRATREKLCRACRQYVILKGVESYSVENLQALIIIAFDSIGAGKGPKSWAIVDSMTRTVEHLRLSFEDDEDDLVAGDDFQQANKVHEQKFMNRMTFLKKPATWIESEERRRVFWNVFLLDRFCSISTGWNPSLTSVDVRRRLPCSGELWSDNKPARARYFGIGFQSSASTPTVVDYESPEVKALGGFAYCVEASEYLSTVTRFFLQQDVTPKSITQLQEWMLGFKDLDLQLARWKFNLPARWREVKVHPKPQPKKDPLIDQNLILAHITHNTSVILLHQFVAYPIASWQVTSMKSSQHSSAETCIAAAKQITNMTQRYLGLMDGIVNPQFAFCLFVCGRMLLSHSSFTKTPLLPEFNMIVIYLADIARRWHGVHDPDTKEDNLASKFHQSLINTCNQMSINGNEKVDITQPVYSVDSVRDGSTTRPSETNTPRMPLNERQATQMMQTIYPELSMSTSPPLPITFQADRSMLSSLLSVDLTQISQLNTGPNSPECNAEGVAVQMDEPSTLDDLSAWFEDPQFLELDRVWTFSNGD